MAKRTWPASVARIILQEGYSEKVGNRLKRSQPTTGPSIVRRQAGKRPDVLFATLLFETYEQYRTFREWFEDVKTGLGGGIYTVDMPHPLTQEIITVRFLTTDDAAFQAAPYQNAALAWATTVQLEVMP